MAKNKNKSKSNAESVLDDVLTGQPQDNSQDSDAAETVESVEETFGQIGQESGQSIGQEPSQEDKEWLDAEAEKALAEALLKPAVASKLTVSVSAPVAKAEGKALLWKSLPAGELEPLLRERAKHHAKMNYGIDVTLTQVDQPLLDKCATDYRFLREMARLTRPQ